MRALASTLAALVAGSGYECRNRNRAQSGKLSQHAFANAFDIAASWLEKVGLKDRARHRPHQLSGGEQQRIAVARAFVTAPRFIFADEPTGNLDRQTSESVAALMFDCARETGCGLVIVTHSRQLAMRANASLLLDAGQLKAAA